MQPLSVAWTCKKRVESVPRETLDIEGERLKKLLALVLVSSVWGVACSESSNDSEGGAGDSLKVVTTVSPITNIAQNIGATGSI